MEIYWFASGKFVNPHYKTLCNDHGQVRMGRVYDFWQSGTIFADGMTCAEIRDYLVSKLIKEVGKPNDFTGDQLRLAVLDFKPNEISACTRELTDPKSVAKGIGPKCEKRV